MVLDNMLVEFLQLAAIDGRKIPALLALQEEVDVFRGVGKKAVANAGCAFDAGAGDDALFFKALKVAIYRGGSTLVPWSAKAFTMSLLVKKAP